MSLDAIRQVHDAEAQAEAMLQDASLRAKKRTAGARAEGQAYLDAQIRKVEEHNLDLISVAEKEADAERARLEQETRQTMDALKAKAEARLSEAADFILERIVT